MDVNRTTALAGLADWFNGLSGAVEKIFFEMHPDAALQDLTTQAHLRAYSGILAQGDLGHGPEMYTPLILVLSAAQRIIGERIDMQHWKPAVENLQSFRHQIRKAHDSGAFVALHIDSPSDNFYHLFVTALESSGHVPGKPTNLDDEDRGQALGMAVTWGIRYLLSAALDYYRSQGPTVSENIRITDGLIWVGLQVSKLISDPENA